MTVDRSTECVDFALSSCHTILLRISIRVKNHARKTKWERCCWFLSYNGTTSCVWNIPRVGRRTQSFFVLSSVTHKTKTLPWQKSVIFIFCFFWSFLSSWHRKELLLCFWQVFSGSNLNGCRQNCFRHKSIGFNRTRWCDSQGRFHACREASTILTEKCNTKTFFSETNLLENTTHAWIPVTQKGRFSFDVWDWWRKWSVRGWNKNSETKRRRDSAALVILLAPRGEKNSPKNLQHNPWLLSVIVFLSFQKQEFLSGIFPRHHNNQQKCSSSVCSAELLKTNGSGTRTCLEALEP